MLPSRQISTATVLSALATAARTSSTLVAGRASLRLQKTAAAAGAVVPGWAAIEELGGVDTVQVDADELFTTIDELGVRVAI